jgi:hypothetical protein
MTLDFIKDILLRYTGRKFVIVMAVCAFVVFAPSFHITLTPDQLGFLKWALLGYLGAEGSADVVSRVTNIPKQEPLLPSETPA